MTPMQVKFASAALEYCEGTQASVTSWYRTAKRNARVGGKQNSAHLEALGLDCIPESAMSSDERHTLASSLGLWLLIEGDHDHLQPLDWRAVKT